MSTPSWTEVETPYADRTWQHTPNLYSSGEKRGKVPMPVAKIYGKFFSDPVQGQQIPKLTFRAQGLRHS